MWLHTIAALTCFISCSILLGHLFYLPYIISQTETAHSMVLHRVHVFKSLEAEISLHLSDLAFMRVSKRSIPSSDSDSEVFCEPGRPGLPGTDGRDGPAGLDGRNGVRGLDARDIMEELQAKQECITCPQGEVGPVGAPGDRGEQGDKGDKGIAGIPGLDGIDGEQGEEGPVGPPGPVGRRGPKGPDGKSAMGGVGQPGPVGVPGAKGGPGLQGPRGKRNYIYGPPGPMGQKGPSGLDGTPGSPGERGPKGPPGEKGADIKFCPCPMELELLKSKHSKLHRPSSPPSHKAPVEGQKASEAFKVPAEPHPPATEDKIVTVSVESSSFTAPTTYPPSTTETTETETSAEPLENLTSTPLAIEEATTFKPNVISTTSSVEIDTTQSVFGNAPGSNDDKNEETSSPLILQVADSREQMIDVPTEFGSDLTSNQLPLTILEETEDYEDTTTTRRFRYVTKRPLRFE